MSGSGGGGYVPPQRTKFDCETSQIDTLLSSIDLAVLKKLKVKDDLDVEIGDNGALIVISGDGELVGSVVHINTSDIIECVNQGYTYKATIIEINFPACKVRIKSF